MKLLLDILQGAGLSTAVGLRPFLPALLAGALAAGDVGLDFDGTPFAFLEAPWFLAVLTAGLIVSLVLRTRVGDERLDLSLALVSLTLGALLCSASIDDRHDTWWYGIPLGIAFALLSVTVVQSLFGRVRARFRAADDEATAAALPAYAEGTGLLVAGASILFPPLAIVAIAFLLALLVTGRRRAGQKYAGLRILR